GRARAHRGGLLADARPRGLPAVQGRARPARRVGGREARPEEPRRRLAVRRGPPLARRRLTASPIGAAGPAAPFAETSGLTDEAPEAVASGAARLFAALPVSLQPDPSLLKYYALSSLALGPLCFFMLVPLYFRFRTLRYDIEQEGITMRWGILFRREVSLTFARIQDIHLTSNFVERWLGLGRIQVQTASGSASA